MQQINLYTDAFRPRKVVLPLEHIIGLTLAAVLILVPVSFWLISSLDERQTALEARQKQVDEMRIRVATLEKQARAVIRDESLAQANRRLQAQIEARERMITMLDSVVVRDDEGFSGILESLARQNRPDLWLNRIVVGAGGKQMMLAGHASSADAVPAYLQNLRQESAFIGRTFTVFNLESGEKNRQQIAFRLRSDRDSDEDRILVTADTSLFQDKLMQGEAQPK